MPPVDPTAVDNAERIIQHAERISALETSVKHVCENHIPHIWAAIREIQLWVRGIAIAVIVAILGMVLKALVG